MQKNLKILLILSSVAIVLVLYLIIKIEPVDRVTKENLGEGKVKIASVDLVKLENEYKTDVKEIYKNYSESLQNINLDANSLEKMKNNLLNLRLPTEFKDLHINFVLALIRMENYLETGDENEKISSQELIEEIKTNYAWLN